MAGNEHRYRLGMIDRYCIDTIMEMKYSQTWNQVGGSCRRFDVVGDVSCDGKWLFDMWR